MKKISCAIVGVFLALGVSAASADCLGTVDEAKILAKIDAMNDSYGDVPASVQCSDATSKVEKLVCASKTLQAMDLLDSKAYVYAFENATGSEIDHKTEKDTDWIKTVRDACTDAECVCEAFKSHTGDLLGGGSPYGE